MFLNFQELNCCFLEGFLYKLKLSVQDQELDMYSALKKKLAILVTSLIYINISTFTSVHSSKGKYSEKQCKDSCSLFCSGFLQFQFDEILKFIFSSLLKYTKINLT